MYINVGFSVCDRVSAVLVQDSRQAFLLSCKSGAPHSEGVECSARAEELDVSWVEDGPET